MSFSKRHGNDAVCYTKPLDSLKRWNDHFFWVDAFACPASFPWNTSKSVSKDPFPKSSEFNAKHYATLVVYRLRSIKMDLLSFIQTADPMKVRVGERQRAEDEPKLLDTTVGRVVPLLPIAPVHAESELDVSVDRLFDEGGSGNLAEQGDSTSGGNGVGISLVSEVAETIVEDGEPIPTLPFVTSSVSATPEREDEVHTDSATGLNLRTIGAPQRLSRNLPLLVHELLQTALAYRERILQYFWTHKIEAEKSQIFNQGYMIYVDANLIHTPALANLHVSNLKPVGTSNGILYFSYGNNMMVCIANPSIRKKVGVFFPTSEPDESKILLGFGIRPDNLDPIVLKFSYPSSGEGNWSVHVFTLSALRWYQLDMNRLPRESIRFKRSTQAVVGEYIYCLGYERVFGDSDDSYKHYLLVSFDMINHRFQEIAIPNLLMRGLDSPLYVSKLRNSLVLSGNIPTPAYYVFVCCQLSINGGSITSFPAIMTMPTHHFTKLLGFNNQDKPIGEAATADVMGHRVQVYMENSQSFQYVDIQGNVGSFFVDVLCGFGQGFANQLMFAFYDDVTVVFGFVVFLVYEELEYRVLLPNDVNYSNLVRYVKKKFKLADGNQICLSYNIGSNHINIIDDDDVCYFVNEVSGEEVKKLYIKLGEPTIQRENEGTVTDIDTDDEGRFKMCFIGFGVAIKSFLCYMRPLIIIDAAHLKGTYLGTNLVAVGMDGNNQIIPIATGVSQGETGESWTWILRKLKECIGEVPNLTIISYIHYAITLACNTVFPNSFHGYCCRHLMINCGMQSDKYKELYWKTCKAYTVQDFEKLMTDIHAVRPDAHQKLVEAGVEKWSRAKCPAN
ncbi:transposase, MuDR, MULE transposase domain protein [Tanacetum coccineum]